VAEDLEMRFDSLLRSTLKAEAGSLPVSVVPADILRRRDQTRRKHASRRIRLLLIAALIALPLGALLAGVLRPDPPPEGYSAVLVRGIAEPELQVLVASHGVAELVADVPASRFGAIEVGRVLEASASGWIALQANDQAGDEFVVLVDVRDAEATPIVREGTYHGAFTPAGLYWSATNTAYELIDPVSGDITSLPLRVDLDWWPLGIYERMRVAADGGLLLGDPGGNAVYYQDGDPYPQQWGVLSPAGGVSRGMPDLAEGVGPRLISDLWGLLQLCEASADNCLDRPSGSIISGPARDGAYRQWGEDLPPHDHVIGASWAVDGGLWLLIDRRSAERTIVLVHRNHENVDREVASFAIDLNVDVRIGDLALDDSQIAIALDPQTIVVDTSSGRSHLFDAAIGGFVPTAVATGWTAGEPATETGELLARPAPGAAAPPRYGPLPSLEEQIDSLSADRILLVHEVEAISTDPGPAIQLTLGPLELDEGIGHSLVCSGPGEITVTEIGPDGPYMRHPYRCLSPTGAGSTASPGVRWPSASVQVDHDPSTTWRLIIYDPPPPRQRP
jgi:hypothetical protein